MIDRARIAILTTVANQTLYRRTSPLFPSGIRRFVIDGSNGMHGFDSLRYMMRKLRGRNIDWLVMADEDVIFIDPEAVFAVITKMEEEGFTVAGVRDGGVVRHRTQNPAFVNTFFCVLRLSEIYPIYDEKELLRQPPVQRGEFAEDWSGLPFPFDEESMYEPYYRFYAWLRRRGKSTLFLDGDMPFEKDAITNGILFNGKRLLYHTWYARSYGENAMHTQRIDAILETSPNRQGGYIEPVVFRDPLFSMRSALRKKVVLARAWLRRLTH